MRLKPKVKTKNKTIAMFIAIVVVESTFNSTEYEFVITSFNDGEHSIGSLHPKDEAFDFRSKHIKSKEEKLAILKRIKESLTEDYDVLLEYLDTNNEHYHLEYDPKDV